MRKTISIKPVVNKKNKQINLSLPRKKISNKLKDLIEKNPNLLIKIEFEDFK